MAGGTLGNGGGRGRIISDINVTPLVDIMLVLLIIFMVTTTQIVRDALDVNLPEASTGEPRQVTLLAVTLGTAGRLALNGQETTEEAIRSYIRRHRQDKKELEAVIAADKTVQHGRVVKIIDLLRQEKIVKFAITVLKEGD